MRRAVTTAQRAFSSRFAVQPQKASTSSVPDRSTLEKGTVQPTVLKPFVSASLQHEDLFNFEKLVHVDEMFKARLHYGHKIGTVNNNMKWALYGERLGVCVFDLDITKQYLVRALNFVAHVAMRGGMILFVTSNRDTMFDVEKAAEEVGQYSHVRKWQSGTLTNTRQLLGASVRLPDAVFFLSTLTSLGENHPAIIEAAKMTIPTIGVVDSNSDPAYLTYLIPANDDTPQSTEYLLRMFKEAIRKGQDERKRLQQRGK
ncbi:Protein CBR-MRPS-2 [Caenorhabditis briggsae]|uniref:Small ribosomal subunit protein uS2m n=2 Tax=Caenorhabditis briggsae TaxID=6238 RepID=A0AAE9A360_CAEBR|nr:Protein CBR-MRPS-2 [Caenorhabditis briggsae]ULT86181.1 hypothetical protein L3Y34_006104 [Caenorhabditis briggsae]CAP22735.1 Protein CBR-MRPS-2 [Caenorhabditis briggsae]